MEKMMDYLKWRGDIPFSVSPLNEADCYLICKIGAIDWAGIIPRQGEPIPFRYAAEKYFLKYGEEGSSTVKLAGPELIPILKKASVSERYGGIGLSGFINIIEERKTEQFSALTATLPDGMRFITFRGTDDNILAWKENFYLSCSDYVSAQRDALAYLRYHSTLFEGPFIVGGHSKGGNLAIYASCAADESIRNRIDSVYCFDGPGFHSEYYDSPGYADMKSRIFKIIPKNSLVGTLLDNPDDVITVSSEDFGIAGHSGFNWETCASGFVKCGELSKSSRKVAFHCIDHGVGIPSDEIGHVWDKYYRTSANHERGIEGTGLGLAIAKGLLNLHNAKYGVDSEEGKGSDFWFELETVKKPPVKKSGGEDKKA